MSSFVQYWTLKMFVVMTPQLARPSFDYAKKKVKCFLFPHFLLVFVSWKWNKISIWGIYKESFLLFSYSEQLMSVINSVYKIIFICLKSLHYLFVDVTFCLVCDVELIRESIWTHISSLMKSFIQKWHCCHSFTCMIIVDDDVRDVESS